MEFFSSLAKTEQKDFSKMTMDYAGPSKEHMHIGCLAGALWRCAQADLEAVLDDDPEGEEYRQKENFYFTHNGVTWPLRATLQNIGGFVDEEVDAEDPAGETTQHSKPNLDGDDPFHEHRTAPATSTELEVA